MPVTRDSESPLLPFGESASGQEPNWTSSDDARTPQNCMTIFKSKVWMGTVIPYELHPHLSEEEYIMLPYLPRNKYKLCLVSFFHN